MDQRQPPEGDHGPWRDAPRVLVLNDKVVSSGRILAPADVAKWLATA